MYSDWWAVIVLLNLLLRGLRYAARHIVGREGEVGDGALFGNRGRIARRVLLEERFQVGIGGIDLLAQIVRRDHRVVELDLDVVLPVEVAHFLVADRHAGGDQRFQATDGDVLLDAVFKVGHRDVEPALNQGGVLVLADELPVREQTPAPEARSADSCAHRHR